MDSLWNSANCIDFCNAFHKRECVSLVVHHAPGSDNYMGSAHVTELCIMFRILKLYINYGQHTEL